MSDNKPFDKRAYDMEYHRTKIKRVPLDMQPDLYRTIKAAANKAGQRVNEYIKQAIKERMERENNP